MDDRQWDDWIREQPGTFWGEEKKRLTDKILKFSVVNA